MNNETNKARTDKILIVDDTSANLQLLTNLLKEQGYLAYPASDGELALEFVRSTPPDLILLDIMMPGMDGYEVCRRLKADDQTRSIPIIFISVLEDERDKVKAFQAGGVDYITKPVRSEEALARVNTHLELRHAQLELEARNMEIEEARETLEDRVRERSSELEQVNHTLREEINRHIQTLKALRESEARYRRIVDTANEGVWVIEPDSKTVSVNGRMAEMLGYTPEEIIGRLFTDFMFEEDIPDHLRQIENRRQGIGGQYERRLRHRDGRTVWTIASAAPLLDEQRRFEGSFAMFTDITERKGAGNELRELNNNFVTVLENTGDFIYFKDRDNRFRFCSQTLANITGHRSWRDMIGKDDFEVFPEETAHIYREEEQPIFNEGKPLLNKVDPYSDAQGERRWMNTNKWPVLDDKGAVVGIFGISRDVTELKVAEEKINELNRDLEQRVKDRTRELAASEERMRLFFERQLVGMAITSPEKGWIQVNDKICEMMGSSREELLRLSWAEMTYPDDLAADVTQFERILRGEIDSYMLEKRFIRKDGSLVFTNLAVGCVRRADRSVDYVLALLEDISERKRAEENINELNAELQQRAKALEDANKELESFSYSVSHDLRAPLRHIDGFVELLQQRTSAILDEKSRHYMTTILDEAKRMGVLIDDLLSFSRMGRQGLSKSQVDLNILVQEIVIELESETRGRTINWHITGLPVVTADRTLVRAVLANVISNAIKFTHPRAVGEIEVGSLPGAEAGPVIYVRDNGVGFDMKYAGKLFGVFQRLHHVEEFEGTGIGLATAYRIITRHGGRIWAEGEVGRGATFYFSLPQSIKEK